MPGATGASEAPGGRRARRDGTYPGVVLASQAVEVSSQEEGRLAAIDVRAGDVVRRGDRLAVLETQQLTQDAAMASAALRASEAEERRAVVQLQKAREQYERRKGLQDIVSREEIAASATEEQLAVATVETARAGVAQERARYQQLQDRLARTILRSPIDGRVALRYMDTGTLVRPGTPVVRLISSQGFLLRFAVPPEQASNLRVGRRVAMRLESPAITVQGTISQIAPQVDAASQMVFIEAEVQVPEGWERQLQDGLAGRVSVLPA
jgi:RND family efflux transporter MFP subunit